jgi:nucleoside-diphosphate-sugar epimerase
MKALITGFSGFIGSHLTDRLLKEGHEVIGIDRSIKWHNLTDPKNPRLLIYHENIEGNISDLFKGVDVVFHLSALTRPQWSIEHPIETNEVNVNGTVKILEYARTNKVKRVVFMSSSNLYGDVLEYPTRENVKANPPNAYALSKLIGEQYCQLFERLYGLEWNACRPFNVYGKRMPVTGIYTSAVATFINALKNDLPLQMFGDGEQRRDFIYIDDVIDQLMLMATATSYGLAFNCGSGTNTSINELYALICKIMGRTIEPVRVEKQFEPSQTLANINRAKTILRWEPKVGLHEGLRRTINE